MSLSERISRSSRNTRAFVVVAMLYGFCGSIAGYYQIAVLLNEWSEWAAGAYLALTMGVFLWAVIRSELAP